jgi:DNA-directed RNA polymerase specialized sigma24 family protein
VSAGTDDEVAPGVFSVGISAARLLRSAATGDRAALAELFDRFGGLFAASIAAVHSDASTRDRLCTEAFAEVWRRSPEGARSETPVLWLLEVLCETLGSSRALARRPLGEGLLALSCPDRELLLLAVAGRYSQPEIAALTGVGEPALRRMLRDALSSLRGAGDGRLTA